MRNFTTVLSTILMCSSISLQAQQVSFEKQYGSSGPATEGQGVRQLPDGNLVTVATQSTAAGSAFQADILLMKTQPDGTPIWSKLVGSTTMREYAQAIDILPSGNIVVAGNLTDLAETRYDALLICFDPSGNVLWQKTYGGVNGSDYFINAIKVVNDGFVASGAYSTVANGDGDAWLLKTNATGDSLWSKTFGGPEYDDSWDMELAPDGGYLLTGGNYSFATGQYDDAWIIKTDAQGNEQWKKNYGLANRVDWAWSISAVKTAGAVTGYVFTGVKNTEENQPGAYYGDIHFVKVDLQGNIVWDKSLQTPQGSYRREGMDIAQLGDGGFVIAAYSVDAGDRKVYIIKTSATGDVIWSSTYGDAGEVYLPRAITTTSDGGAVITGSLLTAGPAQTAFLLKIGGLTTGIKNVATSAVNLRVYPNPGNGTFTIEGIRDASHVNLTVCNAIGQVYTQAIDVRNNTAQLQLPGNLPNGAYLLHIDTGAETIPVSIVLQR